MSDPDCIFCKIVAGQVPARVVHRDDEAIVIEDISPQAPVHVLIIPTEHSKDVHDVPGNVLEHMLSVGRRVAEEKGVAESGYRLVYNVGRDGHQTVFHTHLHLLGGRSMGWPPG